MKIFWISDKMYGLNDYEDQIQRIALYVCIYQKNKAIKPHLAVVKK
jgi:hypothetical protein